MICVEQTGASRGMAFVVHLYAENIAVLNIHKRRESGHHSQ